MSYDSARARFREEMMRMKMDRVAAGEGGRGHDNRGSIGSIQGLATGEIHFKDLTETDNYIPT